MGPRMSMGGARRQNSAKGAIKSASSQNAERHLHCKHVPVIGVNKRDWSQQARKGKHYDAVLPQGTGRQYASCTSSSV